MKHLPKGFSLVELAIVLAVLGVVFFGVTSNYGEFFATNKQVESEQKVEKIKQYLMKYAIANKYLPCPDTDATPTGTENRQNVTVGTDVFERCDSDIGTVPYADIGLELEDVQDGWGNMIRYAVNQRADNDGSSASVPAVICDKREAASYFCREGLGRFAWFTLADTPPTATNAGLGNYFICNENASASDCSGTPSANNLVMGDAIAVLVAFNEDAGTTLANSCAGATSINIENCDVDAYYHQRIKSSVEGSFFDDVVVGINGYDLKRDILSNLTFSSVIPGQVQLPSTFEGYNLTEDDNYTPLTSPSAPDVIRVNKDVKTDLDLDAGDDVVLIGNNLQSEIVYDNSDQNSIATVDGVLQDGSLADLRTGDGDDDVYIVGDAFSSVSLGDGDDQLVVGGNIKDGLRAGDGNDEVWVKGTVEQKINAATSLGFNLDAGDDVLWIGDSSVSPPETDFTEMIQRQVNGGADYDVLIFETIQNLSDLTNANRRKIKNFELLIFADDGNGNRNYHICTNDANDKCTN